jgi:hypothetical protein
MSLTSGVNGIIVAEYDVKQSLQPLVAGNNVITTNAGPGAGAYEVEVRNNTTGAIISARVVAQSPSSFTIFVPVAVASARVVWDV